MNRGIWKPRFFVGAAVVCVINCGVGLMAAYWAVKAENFADAVILTVIALAQLGLGALCLERAGRSQDPTSQPVCEQSRRKGLD